MLNITLAKIISISRKHYAIEFDPQATISTKLFDEGYMNTCILINISNPKQNFIFIIYNPNRYSNNNKIQQIEDTYHTAKYLEDHGIPVRTAIKTKTGKHLVRINLGKTDQDIRTVGLYNYLPGKTLPWEAYTRRHIKSLGLCMARIHKTWESMNFQKLSIPRWKTYLKKDSAKILDYFTRNQDTIAQKLRLQLNADKMMTIVKNIQQLDENQIVHYDFVRGNILFSDKKEDETYPITGIIDFEKTMIATPEVDIARTISFLLIDCKYKTDKQISQNFIKEGYIRMGNGRISRLDVINTLMIYFWVRDIWKFLSSNPYDSLSLNYHYQETKTRLLDSHSGPITKI